MKHPARVRAHLDRVASLGCCAPGCGQAAEVAHVRGAISAKTGLLLPRRKDAAYAFVLDVEAGIMVTVHTGVLQRLVKRLRRERRDLLKSQPLGEVQTLGVLVPLPMLLRAGVVPS